MITFHGMKRVRDNLTCMNWNDRAKVGSTLAALSCIFAHQSRLGDNVTLDCGVDDVTFRFWRQADARVERV